MSWLRVIELIALAGLMVFLIRRSFYLFRSFSMSPATAKSLLYLAFAWLFLIALCFRDW